LAVPIVLLLASCGRGDQPTAPTDTTLRANAYAGSEAFSLERPEEAAVQYQHALDRARARDDAGAIGDDGFDLTVALLAANHPAQALASARMTRAELARRGAVSFPALDLAEATALYRIGDKTEADRLAEQVQAGADPVAAARASFLRGLIADDAGDVAGLDDAIARLAQPASEDQRADADELIARRDLRQRMFSAATDAAGRAANLRRTALDYRGMARALSVAADATARSGNPQAAAELYMRAGQSAAAQGDGDSARPWLRQVLALSRDEALREAAQQAIAALAKPPPASAGR
jgi:hypothetical protein